MYPGRDREESMVACLRRRAEKWTKVVIFWGCVGEKETETHTTSGSRRIRPEFEHFTAFQTRTDGGYFRGKGGVEREEDSVP